MRKLSVKDLIVFRGKSENGKKKFAKDLNVKKQETDVEGGGDYWVTSLSAISNAYRKNDNQIVRDKIGELEEKLENAEYERTKTMYRRNIDILYKYEDFDFRTWQPSGKMTFQKKTKS